MKTLIAFMGLTLFSFSAMAATGTMTVAAPKCDAKALKEKAGAGVQAVKALDWKDGYSVTFEDSKTNAVEVTKNLQKAGCF